MRQSGELSVRLSDLIALAADFDGTLAHEGEVARTVTEALLSLRQAGAGLFLVTGRELDDLQRVFERLDLFDAVVAENGAVLFFPPTRTMRVIAPAPPAALLDLLRSKGVTPLWPGRCAIATRSTQEPAVQTAVRELGLDWCILRNGTSLMCLPPGVDKASGLRAALGETRTDFQKVVAIGDGENDASLFAACGFGVAVANACDELKALADLVTESAEGDGVVEFIGRWKSAGLATQNAR